MTRIAVTGAAGRMGKALIEAVTLNPSMQLTVALERPGSSLIGVDAGELAGVGSNGVKVLGDIRQALEQFDVLIDFTAPDATLVNVEACAASGRKMVIGTTGFTPEQRAQLISHADRTALCMASNFKFVFQIAGYGGQRAG